MNTLIAISNILLFQWVFVRLVTCYDNDTDEYLGWGFLYWVYPCSGYKYPFGWTDFQVWNEIKLWTPCEGIGMTHETEGDKK